MTSDTTHEPHSDPRQSNARSSAVLDGTLGLVGAVAAGAAGCWLFLRIAEQGFYAVALPGALLGWGCGALSGRKSVALGIACGVLGLLLGIYSEWQFAPFVADGSLRYFLTHLQDLSVVTQVMILIGAACAYWFGVGREGGAWPRIRKM